MFNVSRFIFEEIQKIRSSSSGNKELLSTSDILRFIILLAQWPCRMAWLLKFVEVTERKDEHRSPQPKWDVIKDKNVGDVFFEYVDGLMSEDSSDLIVLDADPQLFLRLLKLDCPRVLTANDLVASNHMGSLRDYAFNMPLYMTEKVSRIIDKLERPKREMIRTRAPEQDLEDPSIAALFTSYFYP